MRDSKWENSEFIKVIRVKTDTYNWLRDNKGKLSIAGFANKIINERISRSKKSLKDKNSQ